MIGDIGMIHTCSIISRIQTSQDDYGTPVYTGSLTSSACRFFYNGTGKGDGIITPDSGKHSVSSPAVILPATVTVAEGQTITSTVPGFSKPYEITSVKTIFWMFSNTVHHYECDLKAVE